MCLKRIHFSPATINENLANLESRFIANGGKWEEFRLENLFEKLEYKKLDLKKSNLPKEPSKHCNLPAITCATQNNGISCYVPKDNATIFKNCISVAANGDAPAFYQPHDFTILQDAYVLKFKGRNLEYPHYLYLVTLLQKILTKYDWTNKSGWEKVKLENIKLPTQDDKIAFDFMESFIKELELERIKELEAYLQATGLNNYELTDKEKQTLDIFGNANSVHFYPPQNTPPQTPPARGGAFSAPASFAHQYSKNSPFLTNGQSSYPPSLAEGARGWVNLQWQEFRIGDLFEKISPKYLGKSDKFKALSKIKTDEYNIPIVYAKIGDNGIMYWAKSGDFETYKNILSIIYNGAVAAGLVYAQPYETGILAEAYFIKLKNQNVSFKVNLFLQCVLLKTLYPKYSRDYLATWNNKVENDKILLPTNKDGQIAFEFMESFISAVQKEVIKSVVLWSEKRIQATKQSIL